MTERWSLLDPLHGDVSPTRPALPLPTEDARTRGLNALAGWVASLRFLRTGNVNGPAIAFRIPRGRIHVEQPDHVTDLKFPCAIFAAGRGRYVSGLNGGEVLDETADRYAPGTVLLDLGEYTELLMVEVWGSKRSERRAIIGGIEASLMIADGTQSLRLRLPDYYDSTATFLLEEGERVDDADAARDRRVGKLYITMAVPVVRLVHSVTLQPYLFDLDDLDTSATT